MSKVLPPVDSIKLNVRTVYQTTELEKNPLHYNKNVNKKQIRSTKKFNRKKLIYYIPFVLRAAIRHFKTIISTWSFNVLLIPKHYLV